MMMLCVHGVCRLACPLFSTGTGDADAFARVVNARYCNKKYKPDAIPESVLARMLTLTQRAPSSFNTQPWTCVVVRGEEAKKRLAGAMLGANSKAVLEAPVTAVFAADLESGRLLTKVQDIHRRAGVYPEAFLKKVRLVTDTQRRCMAPTIFSVSTAHSSHIYRSLPLHRCRSSRSCSPAGTGRGWCGGWYTW